MPLIPDELRARARRFPHRPAFTVIDGSMMTFGEWDQRVDAAAASFVEQGVGAGDRVMILVPPEHAECLAVAYLGAQRAGAISVPVNPRLADAELAYIRENCEPALVVTGTDDTDGEYRGPMEPTVDGGAVADILYTSGSTGRPKGVASTHDNVLANPASPVECETKLLHSIPFPTGFGIYGALVMAMRFGLHAMYLPRFDAPRFGTLIATERPSWLLMVPAHVLLLLESGALDDIDTSSVRVLLYGSAPMPAEAVPRLAAAFPKAMLCNGYGLTEAGGSACAMPPGEAVRRPGSVGKPVEGVALRVVDEQGRDLPPNEVGEITLHLAAGERHYWNDPAATAETWRDGWVHTGDLGYVDDDGYLFLVDRKKDLIVRGGYNIYCVEVENALYEHPDIVEAAVIGVPHTVLGEDVCAFVRPRRGAAPLTVDDLRAFLGSRLADYKQPRVLIVRAMPLPRSGAQKIDKRRLRAELATTNDEPPSQQPAG